MYFIQTVIIRCIDSEIFAEIDHKGPNWTFLTLKMTFRVIPYLSYFRAGLVSQQSQRSYMMQYIWAALRYYWIISIIGGKWAKPARACQNRQPVLFHSHPGQTRTPPGRASIFCLFLEEFEDFLPTYNADGEIEVWRNTLPRLVFLYFLFRPISIYFIYESLV